jgi:hypothetical protein
VCPVLLQHQFRYSVFGDYYDFLVFGVLSYCLTCARQNSNLIVFYCDRYLKKGSQDMFCRKMSVGSGEERDSNKKIFSGTE